MTNIKSILLVGKAGSGKDTFAKMFPKLKQFAFGDELKKVVHVAQTNGVSCASDYVSSRTGIIDTASIPILKYAIEHKTNGKQRDVLQVVGQGFRNIEPDIWVNLLKAAIEEANNPPYIITDCRYENEFDAFSDGISIFLNADLSVRIDRIKARDGANADVIHLNHVSETQLEKFASKCDYIVENDYNNMFWLRNQAQNIMDKEGIPY